MGRDTRYIERIGKDEKLVIILKDAKPEDLEREYVISFVTGMILMS